MGVSKNRGTPKSSHLNRVFHYKPSILGYHYFWKHPYKKTVKHIDNKHIKKLFWFVCFKTSVTFKKSVCMNVPSGSSQYQKKKTLLLVPFHLNTCDTTHLGSSFLPHPILPKSLTSPPPKKKIRSSQVPQTQGDHATQREGQNRGRDQSWCEMRLGEVMSPRGGLGTGVFTSPVWANIFARLSLKMMCKIL